MSKFDPNDPYFYFFADNLKDAMITLALKDLIYLKKREMNDDFIKGVCYSVDEIKTFLYSIGKGWLFELANKNYKDIDLFIKANIHSS